MKYTHTIVLLLILLLPLGSMAQSLEIVEEFKENKMSTVLTTYKNEFGHREKQHVMDNKFPFAVLEVYLEGDEQAVKAAKSKLSLDLGSHFTVEGVCKTYTNRIVFLISSSVRNVYMTCGDGCKEQVIFSGQTLEQNKIYYGRVKYTPAKVTTISENQEPLKKQYFKFRIHPADVAGITVLVTENGQQEPWNVAEGIASKKMDYGVYHYVISADRYHKTEGSFTVSDTNNELDVQLRPQFGWLNVSGDNSAQGAYVFATNHSTGDVKQIGTIPLQNTELNAGAYSLRIQKTKYKDYLTTIQIEEGDTTTIRPVLEANFAQLTLAVQNGAEIWLDDNRLGTTSWTGTLELGEYTLEARQANHRSSYTQVVVSEQSVGKTIHLNNPKPIYGTFEVSGSPADATIYVDGKKAGTTPLVVNNVLVGAHKIRIEKEGYNKYEKIVQIAENQESTLDFTLSKTVSNIDNSQVITIDQHKVKQFLTDICKNSSRGGNYIALENYFTETISPYAYHDKTRNKVEIASAIKKFVESYPEYNISSPYNFQFINDTFPLIVKCDVDVTWMTKGGTRKLAKIHKTYYITSNYKVSGFLDEEFDRTTIEKSSTEVNTSQSQNDIYGSVDLGLSVEWATCNVGANKPEEYGDYFAWGETKQKKEYTWSSYEWCNGTEKTLTKYCSVKKYGYKRYVDNKIELGWFYDAAAINKGSSWRMPTDAEWTELRAKCTWTWSTLNGVYGYKVTSKTNGNSIFLPAAGLQVNSKPNNRGDIGYYWSSSLPADHPSNAWSVWFNYTSTYRYYSPRSYGYSVRPVRVH